MSYYPGHEFLNFDFQTSKTLPMFEIPISNSKYKFPSLLQMKDTEKNLIKKNISVCLENSKNLHFQATKSIVQLLSFKLCKDPFECTGEEDLNIFDDKSIALYLEIDGYFQNKNAKGIFKSVLIF